MEKHELTDKSLAYIRSLIESGRLKVAAEEYSVEAEEKGTLASYAVKDILAKADMSYPFTHAVDVHGAGGLTIGKAKVEVFDIQDGEEFDYCASYRFFCNKEEESAIMYGISSVIGWIVNFRSMPHKTMEEINNSDRGWVGRHCVAHVGDIIVNARHDSVALDEKAAQESAIRVEVLLPVKYTVADWPEGLVADGDESGKKEPAQA